MSEEPGPGDRPPVEGAALPQPVERGPRRWAFWLTLGGLALIAVGLLGGLLLPVAEDCPGAFWSQSMVTRVAACKQAGIPMAVVSVAVLMVGAAVIIFGLSRTYPSLRPQVPVRPVAPQQVPVRPLRPQPESAHVVGWVPGPESQWRDMGGGPQRVERRPRKWLYVAAIAVLAVGVLGLGGGYAYSTNSADQWRGTADKTSRDLASMTAERDGLSEKNTSLTSQLSDTSSKLNESTSKLNDANARIRSLANEKAQLGDDKAIYAELIVASQNVSTGMSTCIRDLQKLQTYLVNYTAFDQATLLSVVRGVNSECNKARADSDSLTQTIRGLGK